jgi:acetyl-CoA carboxylase biotin carboxyl carrier protein
MALRRRSAATAADTARPGESPKALVQLVRELGGVLSEFGLSEIEVTWGGVQIRVQRGSVAPPAAGGPAAVPFAPATPAPVAQATSSLVTVEAPMVGTFYRASSPTAEPYVREDEAVKQGQILCIIEAMKLMNEIESRVAGRVAKVLVENGHGVEYGQPLFLIEPVR